MSKTIRLLRLLRLHLKRGYFIKKMHIVEMVKPGQTMYDQRLISLLMELFNNRIDYLTNGVELRHFASLLINPTIPTIQ
jgi:hypothetical protein